jgi:nitrogen fixation protein FixH
MKSKGWYWPLVVVGLLAGGVGANVGLMLVAMGDASFAVEPDYYRKALDWDRTMAQEARNAELGWSVSTRLERGARPAEARLVARLTDRAGAPLGGARVAVEAFPSARASQVVSATLDPQGNGVYAAGLPAGRPGLWELRIRVTRGADVFTRTVSQDLPGRP